ncbi:hypothetical protein ACFXPR_18855 [Nocardia tengchongensis]|uniref:hypothetical protein n=1 Tax=Nocardia tengchongensis TaxID=2055889 RepID=UPI0036BE5DF7
MIDEEHHDDFSNDEPSDQVLARDAIARAAAESEVDALEEVGITVPWRNTPLTLRARGIGTVAAVGMIGAPVATIYIGHDRITEQLIGVISVGQIIGIGITALVACRRNTMTKPYTRKRRKNNGIEPGGRKEEGK